MARDDAPPFERGATWYNGMTIDTNDLGGVSMEGKEFEFEDDLYGTAHKVRVRVVRNSAAFNLKPKRLVTFDTAYYGRRCNGFAAVDAAYCFPVDEKLPAAGVVPNDLFYIVISGPALCKTPNAGVALAVGAKVVALTAASTNDADSGKATDAATLTADEAANKVGRVMSAVTVGQTNADVLVGVGW
jgi:hypothetical protein